MRYIAVKPIQFRNKKVEAGDTFTIKNEDAIKPLIESGVVRRIEGYKIYSELLGCCLWVVADDEDMRSLRLQGISEAVYTADEIKKLKGIDKDSLKAVHKVKEVFEDSKVEDLTLLVKN